MNQIIYKYIIENKRDYINLILNNIDHLNNDVDIRNLIDILIPFRLESSNIPLDMQYAIAHILRSKFYGVPILTSEGLLVKKLLEDAEFFTTIDLETAEKNSAKEKIQKKMDYWLMSRQIICGHFEDLPLFENDTLDTARHTNNFLMKCHFGEAAQALICLKYLLSVRDDLDDSIRFYTCRMFSQASDYLDMVADVLCQPSLVWEMRLLREIK